MHAGATDGPGQITCVTVAWCSRHVSCRGLNVLGHGALLAAVPTGAPTVTATAGGDDGSECSGGGGGCYGGVALCT